MKITHILQGRCNPDSANGVAKSVANLTHHQAVLGHDVSLFCISQKPVVSINGVNVQNFGPAKLPLSFPPGLRQAIDSTDPEVVHFHSLFVPVNVFLSKWLRRRETPYVVTPHGGCAAQILQRRPHLKLPFKWFFDLPHLNKAGFVHSVGDTEDIRKYGVVRPVIVAPNGVDRRSITQPNETLPVRDIFASWAFQTTFLFLGRMDTVHKGLDLLLKGFSIALASNPNIGLAVVGPDFRDHKAKLTRLANTLKVENNVLFYGPVFGGLKFDFLRAADFFVHTSRWDGLPLVVSEALACGTPCVVSKPANPCGLIGTYSAGIQVDLDPHSIARGLLEMSGKTKVERENMKTQALALVDNELDWNSSAQVIVEGYKSI